MAALRHQLFDRDHGGAVRTHMTRPPYGARHMCPHRPACPPADRPDRGAARTVAAHPEQGWSLLCNGVIVFDDLGASLYLAGLGSQP